MTSGQLRVKCFRSHRRVRGYIDPEEYYYQELQRKRWWGWQVLATEEVPWDIKLSLGCYGDMGREWRSAFARLGPFGRDGIIGCYTPLPTPYEDCA